MIRSGVSLDELKRSQHTAAAVWPIECMDLDAYAANVLQEKGIGDTQLIPAQCTQPNKVASFLSNPPTHQLTLFATRPADQSVTPSIAQPDPSAAQPADDFVLVDGEEIDTDWDIIEASINRPQSPG